LRRLVAVLAIGAGCGGSAPLLPSESVRDRLGVWIPGPGATLLSTPFSSLDNPTMAVVSSPAAWLDLWTRAWTGISGSPALPPIDFVLSSVVVLGLGSRAGRTFSVTIDSIVQHIPGAVLYATEWQVGASCDLAAGLSAPLHMVHAPGHPPVIDWRVGMARRNCGSD
jgi:hypothetical protein